MSQPRGNRIRAFTLIEILVVVTIIAIISLITVPTLRSHLQRGKVNNTRLLISTLENCIWSYYSDLGQFPPSGSDFLQEALVRGLGREYGSGTPPFDPRNHPKEPRWKGPYIKLDENQLLRQRDVDKHMPKFLDGAAMIPPSSRAGVKYEDVNQHIHAFIVDSWGYPLFYINSDTMLWAAVDGSGMGYQDLDGRTVGPYFPAWRERDDSGQLNPSPPRNREDVNNYHNYSAGRVTPGASKAFQIYSVGADGKTRRGDGGPGTLSIHDGRDNDGDGLIDEKDNDRSTRNGTPPEDDINNWDK